MRSRLVLGFVILIAASSSAGAQPLVDRGFDLDITDLTVLGSSRAVGLGGAFASSGSGASAMGWNPAAAATRTHWESDWFEWEIAFGALFSGPKNSLFGRGSADALSIDGFSYFDVGLRLQFGPAAFGFIFRPRMFDVGVQDVLAQTGRMDLAWALLDGQLVLGLGATLVELGVDQGDSQLVEAVGASFEAGATYLPSELPMRAALVVRAPIRARRVREGSASAGLALPDDVLVPWEIVASGTFGFGERPLNAPPPIEPRPRERRRRERVARESVAGMLDAGDVPVVDGSISDEAAEAEVDREPIVPEPPAPRPRYGFVTTDLVIAGPVPNGVGLDGFLTQTERRWGRRTTFSPRLGVEGEPWRNRMKLRGGLYLEPNRSELSDPRLHFTHGFDVRLFSTDVFGWFDEPIDVQVTWVADFAREYVNVGFGVGLWH